MPKKALVQFASRRSAVVALACAAIAAYGYWWYEDRLSSHWGRVVGASRNVAGVADTAESRTKGLADLDAPAADGLLLKWEAPSTAPHLDGGHALCAWSSLAEP
jgi:hypothetical protein